jgi:hypothetical protein
VPVPTPLHQLAEDDKVAAIDGDDLPVAAAQRALGPPAVLDQPGLADGDDLVTVDQQRAAARSGVDVGGPRYAEAAAAGAYV